MRVGIRADASQTIGSGHIARMLSLAAALTTRGAQCTFLSKSGAGDMHDAIQRAGFAVVPPADDAPASIAPLDLLVVDAYDVDAAWERRARRYARRLCAIDDTGREHDCDVLLDQNLGADESRYAGKIPPEAMLLTGPHFALLREEFRELARHVPERSGAVRRILVSFGGSDAGNETMKVVRALASRGPRQIDVEVVLPRTAPHAPEVEAACADQGLTYLAETRSFAGLLKEADLAIGAGGATMWERCIAGLPAVVITVAENQRPAAAACAKEGVVSWLGDSAKVNEEAISHAVSELLADPQRVRAMSERARGVVHAPDGMFSTDRAAAAIVQGLQ